MDPWERREMSLKEAGPIPFYFATFKEVWELKHA